MSRLWSCLSCSVVVRGPHSGPDRECPVCNEESWSVVDT